ncbi:glycosyltransferase [Heyndrickxia coagulans]|nr:glycosyltransferase [Heyndrickxia coagulans]
MKNEGHNVFLVSFFDKSKEKKFDFEKINQILIDKNYENKPKDLIRNLFQKLPFSMKKYIDPTMELKIIDILNKNQIDIVILDHLHMAYYVNFIKKLKPNIPVFLRQHNIESIILKRAYETEKLPLRKLYLLIQYKKLRKYESEICSKMDKIFVITDEDKKVLQKMNSDLPKIGVVKAGVDLNKYKPLIKEEDKQNYNLVFVGSMSWLPNENGMLWFCENVLPRLINNIPNIKLYIVGKNPSEKIKSLEMSFPNHVEVTGYVEDEREYISMGDVFIVPLLIGGGMRLKILNALAMKRAVISTSIGAEGINLKSSYLIADTPKDFGEKIELLIRDKEYREKLEIRGYNEVVENYSFKSVLKPLLESLNRNSI